MGSQLEVQWSAPLFPTLALLSLNSVILQTTVQGQSPYLLFTTFFSIRLQSGLCLMEPEKSTYLLALKVLMLTENVSGKCHPNLNVTGLSLGWHVS